jgi:hypothetical protein
MPVNWSKRSDSGGGEMPVDTAGALRLLGRLNTSTFWLPSAKIGSVTMTPHAPPSFVNARGLRALKWMDPSSVARRM